MYFSFDKETKELFEKLEKIEIELEINKRKAESLARKIEEIEEETKGFSNVAAFAIRLLFCWIALIKGVEVLERCKDEFLQVLRNEGISREVMDVTEEYVEEVIEGLKNLASFLEIGGYETEPKLRSEIVKELERILKEKEDEGENPGAV